MTSIIKLFIILTIIKNKVICNGEYIVIENAFGRQKVYIDGVLYDKIEEEPNDYGMFEISKYLIAVECQVVAVEIVPEFERDSGEMSARMFVSSYPRALYSGDPNQWKCIRKDLIGADEKWYNADYNDAHWPMAVIIKKNEGEVEGFFASADDLLIGCPNQKTMSSCYCRSQESRLNNTTPVSRKAVGASCSSLMDVVFLLDESYSVCNVFGGCSNWEQMKEFISQFVDGCDIGNSANEIAMIKFGEEDDPTLMWNFGEYSGKDDLKNKIIALSYGGTLTYTGAALLMAERDVINGPNNRKEAVDIIIVITDGIAGDFDVVEKKVADLTAAGVKIFAVGIGSIDQPMIAGTTSPPQKENKNYFMSSDFKSLNRIIDQLRDHTVCNEGLIKKEDPVDPGDPEDPGDSGDPGDVGEPFLSLFDTYKDYWKIIAAILAALLLLILFCICCGEDDSDDSDDS